MKRIMQGSVLEHTGATNILMAPTYCKNLVMHYHGWCFEQDCATGIHASSLTFLYYKLVFLSVRK
jgi:hypothetical protein